MKTSTDIQLLASSWLNVSLYTLELVLCRRYFQRPNRPFFYKLGVGALIFFDTVCTLTICVNLCLFVLRIKGNPVALLVPTSLIILMTYCSAAVEQAILCHLFFSLTNNIIVTAFLAILILAHLGLALASGALILVLDSERTAALNTATATSVTCAATDIFIAIALSSRVWGFLSAADVIPSRDSFSRRFFLLSISAGVVVASNTLVMMILLLGHSDAFTFFFTCQGRVYSLTLLANFLVGIPFRRDNTTTDGSTASRSPQGQYASAVTGVLLDVVYGYDTESASNQSLSAPRRGTLRSKSKATWTGTVASKAPLGSGTEPVPYNYNLDAEWMQLEHRQMVGPSPQSSD
ncbi:hypothetical protein C8F01DRAFT_1144009 [Mycena amicta]|nr:hypothetical protein C8F01DRAFT_1144009 [Mycena amicta]